jgi:hypothetical protein
VVSTAPDRTAIRNQHAGQIREDALRIQEFTGYLIARVARGRPDAVGEYAADIVAAGQRIMVSHATIVCIDALAKSTEGSG